jgi:hypothetical protein
MPAADIALTFQEQEAVQRQNLRAEDHRFPAHREDARDTIVGRGGFSQSARGILVKDPTKTESEMVLHQAIAGTL